jgi:hypothetical protein
VPNGGGGSLSFLADYFKGKLEVKIKYRGSLFMCFIAVFVAFSHLRAPMNGIPDERTVFKTKIKVSLKNFNGFSK